MLQPGESGIASMTISEKQKLFMKEEFGIDAGAFSLKVSLQKISAATL